MKNILCLFLLISATGFSQEHGTCGFDEHNEQIMNQNPALRQYLHEHLIRMNNGDVPMAVDRSTFIIPVVVHVIHDGGESNISHEQILSAIDMINDDYQLLNSDTVNIRNTALAPFDTVKANVGIEFQLARLDPDGNCTNGVERRLSPGGTQDANDEVKHYDTGGLDAWPRQNYLNIWVVSSISTGSGGTTLGYAQFPYLGFGATDEYGVVIRHDRLGSTGTANSGDRTLTHEIGHCLGLFHTFEGGCEESGFSGGGSYDCTSGGDYICDTPPVSQAQWSCNDLNTCDSIGVNDSYGIDALDQYENYMSYSPCQFMFSTEQKDRILTNIADISFLSNLTSASNATATGLNSADILCEADFSASKTVICQGDSVNISDQSYFGITGRTWYFAGGTPLTAGDSSVYVTYNTAGSFAVGLEVTDGTNSLYTEEQDYIVVLPVEGEPLPYHEGFEFYNDIPDNHNWFVQNDDGGQTWELNNDTYYTGGWSAKMNNYSVDNGSKDHLISGTIDLSSLSSSDVMVFNFKYAYHKKSSSNSERLRVYVSSNCGESWSLRKTISGSQLGTDVTSTSYIPGVGEWTNVDITNITSSYFVDNLRVRFEFENDGGNNLYLDNINMYAEDMASITEEIVDNLEVFPNPVSELVTISMDIYDAANYRIILTNTLGQEISDVYNGELLAGEQIMSFDMSDLPEGIYFLQIESNGYLKTTKVVKQ